MDHLTTSLLATKRGENIKFLPVLTREQENDVLDHLPVAQWISRNTDHGAEKFVIRDVVFFGKKVGFVFAEAQYPKPEKAMPTPGFAFLRSDAVCALIVIKKKGLMGLLFGNAKVLLTREARSPMGGGYYVQLAAGMTDGEKNIRSKLVQEVNEEVGLNISQNKVIYMGSDAASPGGSNEVIHFYAIELFMSARQIKALENDKAVYGNPEEGEKTTRVICNIKDVDRVSGIVIDGLHIANMKTRLAVRLYREHVSWAKRLGL